jgi:deoxycytidylate deaminase
LSKFCKVAHNDVGAVLAKNLRVVAPGYADDKTEAARPARLYSGDGILYHDGLLREVAAPGTAVLAALWTL